VVDNRREVRQAFIEKQCFSPADRRRPMPSARLVEAQLFSVARASAPASAIDPPWRQNFLIAGRDPRSTS
jgi:hypothetical protein